MLRGPLPLAEALFVFHQADRVGLSDGWGGALGLPCDPFTDVHYQLCREVIAIYHQYFGLSESPFSIAVNPRYLFMSPRHRDALAHLLYGVGSGGGFILLTGEVGTGKTTINRCLLEQMPETTDLAIVLNPALSAVELLATVCDELGIEYPAGTTSLKHLTDALHRYLLANHEAGRKTVLMIDEAQHLEFDVLEQIRLLTNLETDQEKLLQIILIGQPELSEKLARPELRQLNQRITARYDLQPLNAQETAAYIRHRLEVAGLPGGRELFSMPVVREIHRRSRGIPRQINLLCDRTLLGAYGRKQNTINRKLVRDAAAEVFGQHGQPVRDWRLPLLAGISLVSVLLLGVVLLWPGDTPQTPLPSPSAAARPSVAQPTLAQSSIAQLVKPIPTAAQTAEALARAEQSVSTVALPTATTATTGVGQTVAEPGGLRDSQPTVPQWLLSDDLATVWWWRLHSDGRPPGTACPERAVAGWQCVEARAGTLLELSGRQRPLLLTMRTPDGFSAKTLVLGFEANTAWVLTGQPGFAQASAVAQVPLDVLNNAWRGDYQFLWQVPNGWRGPMGRGDTGAAVNAVAADFAALDGQPATLLDEGSDQFNNILEQRVMLFQSSEGLVADGVVGEQTYIRLNERLGRTRGLAQSLERIRRLLGATASASSSESL